MIFEWREIKPHCAFHLHFLDSWWIWASFHVFVGHLNFITWKPCGFLFVFLCFRILERFTNLGYWPSISFIIYKYCLSSIYFFFLNQLGFWSLIQESCLDQCLAMLPLLLPQGTMVSGSSIRFSNHSQWNFCLRWKAKVLSHIFACGIPIFCWRDGLFLFQGV